MLLNSFQQFQTFLPQQECFRCLFFHFLLTSELSGGLPGIPEQNPAAVAQIVKDWVGVPAAPKAP